MTTHTAQDATDAKEQAQLDTVSDAVVAHLETDAEQALHEVHSNADTSYAVPYYTTPEGAIRVGFEKVGGMIGLPDMATIVLDDAMQIQPLSTDTHTAMSINLGAHSNAPPLQASSDMAAERIWIDVSAITPVAGGLPSLDATKPTPGYTAQINGESYILSPDQTAVMAAAVMRLDALQAKKTLPANVNIQLTQHSDTPTPVAQALNAQHHATVNATDMMAALGQ